MAVLMRVVGGAAALTGLILMKVVGVTTTYTFGPGGTTSSTNWAPFIGYVALVVGGAFLFWFAARLDDSTVDAAPPSDQFSSNWSDEGRRGGSESWR